MSLHEYFPATAWLVRALTGRWARRIYLAFLALIVAASAVVRVRAAILTHRMYAVIEGLSKLRIDETTDEDVPRIVPYLIRGDGTWEIKPSVETGDVDEGAERRYYVKISNKRDWVAFANFADRYSDVEVTRDGFLQGWIITVADFVGYRYVGFAASVAVLNGKVSSVEYWISNAVVVPGPLGGALSVRSAHSTWAPYRMPFGVSSTSDESPQFNISGDDVRLAVRFSPDASPQSIGDAFHVYLSCFWGLRGCWHASQIAPLVWRDKRAIETATLARLKSDDPCPDRILAGRIKYLPDISVTLLAYSKSERTSVIDKGRREDEIVPGYKVTENLRGGLLVLSMLPNPRPLPTKPSDELLLFSSPWFESCSLVPATPSAVAAIRNSVPAPRRLEDQLAGRGL